MHRTPSQSWIQRPGERGTTDLIIGKTAARSNSFDPFHSSSILCGRNQNPYAMSSDKHARRNFVPGEIAMAARAEARY
jgi:hypothetical protein